MIFLNKLALCLIFCLIISPISCGSSSPKETVKEEETVVENVDDGQNTVTINDINDEQNNEPVENIDENSKKIVSDKAEGDPKNLFTNSIDMEFVLIPAGTYTSSWGTYTNSWLDRTVTISKPFYIGKFEVTQEQWTAVMGECFGNTAFSSTGSKKEPWNPVEGQSWLAIQIFIEKLNKKEGYKKYRLPTEAEWEYAARAGTETDWFWGNDVADLYYYAWYRNNSKKTSHPVGIKKPNPFGLHDVYGNVWEFVQDWYGQLNEKTATDPTGPDSGSYRLVRGGNWDSAGSPADFYRFPIYTDENDLDDASGAPVDIKKKAGFRLAFSSDQEEPYDPAAPVFIPGTYFFCGDDNDAARCLNYNDGCALSSNLTFNPDHTGSEGHGNSYEGSFKWQQKGDKIIVKGSLYNDKSSISILEPGTLYFKNQNGSNWYSIHTTICCSMPDF
jgi:formylglycine-generating enzyme required for sulfatase activity